MAQVILALGGNIGDVKDSFKNAINLLQNKYGCKIVKKSSLYSTQSLLKDEQPDYINMAVLLETAITPIDLLKVIKTVERELGRIDTNRWGERVIDIDIIDFNQWIIFTKELTIPHPQMSLRSFVLYPLKEINSNYINPATGQNIDEMISVLTKNTDLLAINKI